LLNRPQNFAFDSPGAAVAAFIENLRVARPPRDTELIDLGMARGRILAAPVAADRDSPAFDHSAMDGYALRIADLQRSEIASQPIQLPVAGESRIGLAPPEMPPVPAAVRISTGAGLPRGADLVVRREDVLEHAADGPAVAAISIPHDALAAFRAGDFIRRRGENGRCGEAVLAPGAILSPAALGALAAVGCITPRVYSHLRVALLTIGDELVPPASTPHAYQVRNSNAPALAALVSAFPWVRLISHSHIQDDDTALTARIREAIHHADALILTGGVSMGHRDPVMAALQPLNAQLLFRGLPLRPGKPIVGALARQSDGTPLPIFGLPGNPNSALVTCMRIVIPVLAALAGASHWPAPLRVALANPDGASSDLWLYRLVRINDRGDAERVTTASSGDIIAAGSSDGFIEVPPGHAPAMYPFHPWPT
jgi:molybdopterin molybdotransferase